MSSSPHCCQFNWAKINKSVIRATRQYFNTTHMRMHFSRVLPFNFPSGTKYCADVCVCVCVRFVIRLRSILLSFHFSYVSTSTQRQLKQKEKLSSNSHNATPGDECMMKLAYAPLNTRYNLDLLNQIDIIWIRYKKNWQNVDKNGTAMQCAATAETTMMTQYHTKFTVIMKSDFKFDFCYGRKIHLIWFLFTPSLSSPSSLSVCVLHCTYFVAKMNLFWC